ncbi:carboxypeptidase-like regulatory domain-containing protein [Carboxylicivirga taeanensis]|uniref:carboxypeptidase-like regulatory domain-containing protein n=1 Tax=Carboxylicivirga taeanensis TaxID=1416875 RepID=UPI003F6E1AEB
MKYKPLVFLLLFSTLCVTANAQKTIHYYLDSVAQLNSLELTYSEDLVNLQKTIYPEMDSLSLDDYISKLALSCHLDIQRKDNYLIVTNPNAQTIKISGTLIDLSSGEPQPFAHISQRNWGTGSITNSEGEFELNIPSLLVGLKLDFSSLGYADTSIIIPRTDSLNLIVHIRPKPFNLNEVLVLPNGNTAEDLVRLASKRIKRNFHRKTAQMEAFYRRTGFRDSTFVQLIEAALLIEDKGIDMPTSTTKIQIEEVRKSQSYLIQRSAKYKWAFDKMEKMIHGGHRNMFYRAYNNPVRAYKSEWWYQPLTDYENFNYEFEGAMWLDTIKVYKVLFEYNALYPNGKRASINKSTFHGGHIYIDANDYGIHKMDYLFRLTPKHKNAKFTIKEGIFDQSEISYQKIEGKYYLKYISEFAPSNAKNFIFENPDADQNEKVIKHRQWAETLLVITNVVTERQERQRISNKSKLDLHENSYETNYPYNPDFWENYSMIKQKPLPGKAIEDLEWEKSLELQFLENSTSHVEN